MLTRLDSLLFFLDQYLSLEWLQIHFEFTCFIIDIDNFFFVKPIDEFCSLFGRHIFQRVSISAVR